eukprot:TRINITY_DN26935_c0_g1_i3.p1 TRINITY_DN26935_c0_g1~~TRINITY_DN26935_c0_g1_i3.p1  ORF type:complete len:217 (-),score=44.68 TRINITY_DN26935_c0_g1_i3:118-768(-)
MLRSLVGSEMCIRDRFTKMLKAYVDHFVQSPRGRELRDALDSTFLGATQNSNDQPHDTGHSSSSVVSPRGSHADLSTTKKMSSFSISTLKEIHNTAATNTTTTTTTASSSSEKDGATTATSQTVEYINPFAGARRARSSASGSGNMPTATIEEPLQQSPSDAYPPHASLNKRAGSQHQLQDAQMLSMSIRGGGSNAGMLFDKIRRVQMKQENRTDY